MVTIGELLVDFAPAQAGSSLDGAEILQRAAGGAPANAAAAVARLGGSAAFIGRVGADAFGRFLKRSLAATGVDVRHVATDPDAPTTLAFVSLDEQANRDFVFYRADTADTRLSTDDLDDELLRAAAVLHFCSNSLTHESSRAATLEAARRAAADGALVSFDVNWRAPLWSSTAEGRRHVLEALKLASVVKVSEEDLAFVAGSADAEAAHDLLLPKTRLLLVSAGADGVHVLQHGRHAHVPAWPVTAIDTTGAGDALAGALLLQLAAGPGLLGDFPALLAAVARAQAYAALSTTRAGAIPSYGTAAELEEFLRVAAG